MPEYASCPIRYCSGTPLAVVYDKIDVDNTGAVATIMYWNHALEVYEPGPLVPEKHVLPLTRFAATGPYSNNYLLFLAEKPFRSDNATAVVFELDSAGALSKSHDNLSKSQVNFLSGVLI